MYDIDYRGDTSLYMRNVKEIKKKQKQKQKKTKTMREKKYKISREN